MGRGGCRRSCWTQPRPDFVIGEHLPPAEEMGVYNGKR